MGFHKSTLVTRGANTQLDPNCVSASLTSNVDFLCFAECLFKSSSISHWPCRRIAIDSLYVGWAVCVVNRPNGIAYVWSIDRTAKTMPSWHWIQSNVPRRFIDCNCTLMETLCFHIDGNVIRYQYLTMCEDVAVSCDAYGELQMILNILSGIEPGHLSSGHKSMFRRL